MQILSGRLLEVVAYKNRNTGGHLPRRGLGTSTAWKITYCMQFLIYAMCSSVLLLKFLAFSKQHSAHSEHREQRMRQVVAYKRLKTMENHSISAQKVISVAYWRWSFIRGSKCKALTGKTAVYWFGGHLWEVVAYERWSHMEVQLYID